MKVGQRGHTGRTLRVTQREVAGWNSFANPEYSLHQHGAGLGGGGGGEKSEIVLLKSGYS